MPSIRKQKCSMRKSKQRNSRRSSRSRSRKHYSKHNVQRGGVSNSCVLDSSMSGGMSRCQSGVNLHNTNPQASLDLDNKFMAYGGPVPLGNNILQGGANKCGDDGVGTSNPKSETFQQYLDSINNKLEVAVGGGFSTDPSEYIAGLPVYKGYDDCCPPAIVGGQLQFGAPDQPVCGFGAVKGGSRKNMNNMNNMKKTKKQLSKKSRSSNRKQHRRSQRGGDWTSSTRSKPAVYSEAFNGPKGVFSYPDDMSKRAFDEVQPNYSVNAI